MGLLGDEDQVQILEGLAPGEKVVTSGQFLMDVEDRLPRGDQKMRQGAERPGMPSHAMGPGTIRPAGRHGPAMAAADDRTCHAKRKTQPLEQPAMPATTGAAKPMRWDPNRPSGASHLGAGRDDQA